MITYNQLIKKFETFADLHPQINAFYSDQTYAEVDLNRKFPEMIVISQPGSIQEGQLTTIFQITIADLLAADDSNLNEILSDTEQIAIQLISYLSNDENIVIDYSDIPIEKVSKATQAKDDIVAANIMQLTIYVPFTGIECISPITV